MNAEGQHVLLGELNYVLDINFLYIEVIVDYVFNYEQMIRGSILLLKETNFHNSIHGSCISIYETRFAILLLHFYDVRSRFTG